MSYIYLIECQSNDLIHKKYKIGVSKNIDKRLKQLKTGNPYPIQIVAKFSTKYNKKLETTLHNIYKTKNINGEWFILSDDEVNNFLKECEKIENNFDMLKRGNNHFFK